MNIRFRSVYLRSRRNYLTKIMDTGPIKGFPYVHDATSKDAAGINWGGSEGHSKIHWVEWDKGVTPRKYEGLGIGSLRDINLCPLAKWWWRFKVEPTSLRRCVVYGIHNKFVGGDIIPSKPTISRVWNNLTKLDGALHKPGN